MADNTTPLLAPVAVEALVVNHLVQNGVTFHRWEMEYGNLSTFQSPTPPPSGNLSSSPPDPGVHLHWALPRALTRGAQVQATATAEVSNGQVTSLTVVNGGYGYTDALPPIVLIVGEEGTGALANAVVTNGVVTGFELVSPGGGYTQAPQVTVAPSPAISFPFAPNRWLVVRYSPAPSASQPRPTMAWLLQSDSIDPDADTFESNSFVNPFPSTAGAIEPTRLGAAATVLGSWAGESGSTQQLFLQAMGPGEATFAAYQPGVLNVFSFYDPILDPDASYQNPNYPKNAQQFPENTALTYTVVGWYSDPTHDPLYGPVSSWDSQGYPTRSPWGGADDPTAAWVALMEDLNWYLLDTNNQPYPSGEAGGGEPAMGEPAAGAQDADDPAPLPSQSVFHGSVYGVQWQTTTLPAGVTELTLTGGGSGYTSAPSVAFSGGGGTGATAAAQVQNGAVVSLTLLGGGSGYTSAPTVTLSGGGGAGATATAQIWNDLNGMTVAVGNTSIDALAAVVRQYADTPEDGAAQAEMLEAFQYNYLKTLDDADGDAQLDLKIRQAWFASVPGGTIWQVVAAQTVQTAAGQLSPDAVPPPPPLTSAQAALLAELNRSQRALDAAWQLLASMQWELYGTWWKQKRLATMPALEQQHLQSLFDMGPVTDAVTQNLDPTNTGGLFQQVVSQQAAVQALMQPLPDPTNQQSIQAYAANVLGLDPAQLQLKAATMPRFYQPADPVVLVAGVQTSDKQGSLSEDDALFCRYVSQAVTGVNVQTGEQTVQATASTGGLQQIIPTVSNPHLPAAVAAGLDALCVETFFSDYSNAPAIAGVGLNITDAGAVSQLQTAMALQTAQFSTIPTPLEASFAFSLWAGQPWSPLYMEWNVTFYPTVLSGPNNNIPPDNWPFMAPAFDNPPTTAAQPCWSFNGIDFDWYGNGDLPATYQGYTGRTFLTPQSTYILISRLKAYLASNPDADLQAVEALIDRVGDWSFLSQRLSGLSDQLIMRDIQPNQPPDDSVAQQVGDEYHAVPDPSKGNQDTDFGGGSPFFFPVRGGFLQFNTSGGLIVVDAFGQVLDLMSAGGNTGTGVPWAPVRGRGLAPGEQANLPQPSELIQLAPRLVQTSRLDFRFISAADDGQETGLWPDASPVCGWVLPNHLDKSLMIYDAGGDALGEVLLLADTSGDTSAKWLPAPDSAAAVADPSQISNSHLSKFVVALTGRQDQGVGFQNFLRAIDETQWTIDPLGSRSDQNLSVLIGRPLALLRAQLQLELEGQPVYNQSWPDSLMKQTAAVEAIEFPVNLGSLKLYDDGLLGYFEDDAYAAFNSVHTPAGFEPAEGSYLKPIGGPGGNYLKLAFDYPNYTTKFITMLLDPRGDVHAFTGILPVKTVSLPAAYFEDALARMAVTFRTGPVLTDAQAVRLPYPSEQNGTWSWVQRTGPDPQDWTDPAGWEVSDIVRANQTARLPDTPARMLEGWLKLTPTDIEE